MPEPLRGFMPVWHPPEGGFSGGNVLAKAFADARGSLALEIVDTDSTDISPSAGNRKLVRLRLSWAFVPGFGFALVRGLNWAAYCAGAVWASFWNGPIDFVYVPTSEMMATSLAGFVVSRLRRVPLILSNLNVRGISFWSLNRHLHNRAVLVIARSPALERELRSEGITAPIAMGTIGVDDGSVPRKQTAYDGVYVGRHTKEKGVFDLIRIWALCVRSKPKMRLALAGPCSLDVLAELQRMLAEYDIEKNVVIHGPVDERTKWNLYAESAVCLFASHVEAWGIVPVEAILAGIPVVAYDLPAYEVTIRSSPGASVVPVGDLAAFAAAVLKTLEHPYDPQPGREWAAQFTWARAISLEEQLIQQAVGLLPRGTPGATSSR